MYILTSAPEKMGSGPPATATRNPWVPKTLLLHRRWFQFPYKQRNVHCPVVKCQKRSNCRWIGTCRRDQLGRYGGTSYYRICVAERGYIPRERRYYNGNNGRPVARSTTWGIISYKTTGTPVSSTSYKFEVPLTIHSHPCFLHRSSNCHPKSTTSPSTITKHAILPTT
jgi:hypothetical protein